MTLTNKSSSIIRDRLNPGDFHGLSSDAEYTIAGYAHQYRGRRYGAIAVEDIYRITKYDGNQPADFQHVAARCLFFVSTVWNVVIRKPPRSRGNFDAYIGDVSGGKGFSLPIALLHTDVLPEIARDDELDLRVFCIPDTLIAHEDERSGDVSDVNLAVSVEEFSDIAWEERQDKVFFAGKILSVSRQEESFPQAPLLILTMETFGAPVTVICNPRMISEEQGARLVPGNRIRVTGWLYGDAATGEYSDGIVLDLEHDLRLTHSCVCASDFWRATQIFARDSKYIRRGELVATGPGETVAFLDSVAEYIKSEGLQPDIGFGQIEWQEKAGNPAHNEKCLVYFTSEGSVHNILYGRVDETGRLSLLESVYEFDGMKKLAVSQSVAIWYESLDSLESEAEEEKSWFDDPNMAERMHGDREAFYGEPIFGFGDVLDAFLPMEGEHLHEQIDMFIRHAQSAGDYTLRNGDFWGAYYDYPDRDFTPGIQLALCKERDAERYELKYLYPLLKGRDHRLNILARFDWTDNICGMVAANWKNASIRNYFVPSYGLCHELLKPGNEIALSVSGYAINVERVPQPKFSVTEGPLFELELAKFLAAYPDQTAADFTPPVVDASGAVISFPTAHTCYFQIQSPLVKMEKLTFLDRKFVRMLLTLDQDMETDEEMQTWIYADEERIRSLDLHPGDPLLCLVWFCASVI